MSKGGRTSSAWLRGPRFAAICLASAVTIATIILVFDIHDTLSAEEWYPTHWASALTWALRVTVSISAPLFIAAFTARPLNDLFHSRITRWMLKNRRYLGLGCAAFLLQHLWLLPLMHIEYGVFTQFFRNTNLFPSAAILLLATLLTLTSFNTVQRSWPYWKWLHWTGVQAMWFWYTKAFYGEWSNRHLTYQLVLLSAMLAAQGVRIIAFAKQAATQVGEPPT